MAELGLLANVAGVVGGGLQLSIAIYDLASTFRSAGPEMEDMGREITLLCRVLKQVQSSLDQSQSRVRLSITALQDTQDIVDRCQLVLKEIQAILDRLGKHGSGAAIDFIGRVKWTFKRPKVLMLRGSLQSCTAHLHLMLYIMDRARMYAAKRSTNSHLSAQDEDLDRQMTHSLFLAQQTANRRLAELEDQAIKEPPTVDVLPTSRDRPVVRPDSASLVEESTRRKQNRTSIMVDAIIYDRSPKTISLESKKTSVLLNERLFNADKALESICETPFGNLDRRQSIVHADVLLRRWTHELDSASEVDPDGVEETQRGTELVELDRSSYVSFDAGSEASPVSDNYTIQPRWMAPEELLPTGPDGPLYSGPNDVSPIGGPWPPVRSKSPKSSDALDGHATPTYVRARSRYDAFATTHLSFRKGDLIQVLTHSENGWCEGVLSNVRGWFPIAYCVKVHGPDARSEAEPEADDDKATTVHSNKLTAVVPLPIDKSAPSHEISNSFRMGSEDPCHKVLSMAFRQWGIVADWRSCCLYVVYEDRERLIGMNEKPLAIFKDLQRQGLIPTFVLRKIAGPNFTKSRLKLHVIKQRG